ncbi:MAG: hypothetical protein AAF602_18460, partial [Myxococcota bacterium]
MGRDVLPRMANVAGQGGRIGAQRRDEPRGQQRPPGEAIGPAATNARARGPRCSASVWRSACCRSWSLIGWPRSAQATARHVGSSQWAVSALAHRCSTAERCSASASHTARVQHRRDSRCRRSRIS